MFSLRIGHFIFFALFHYIVIYWLETQVLKLLSCCHCFQMLIDISCFSWAATHMSYISHWLKAGHWLISLASENIEYWHWYIYRLHIEYTPAISQLVITYVSQAEWPHYWYISHLAITTATFHSWVEGWYSRELKAASCQKSLPLSRNWSWRLLH